MKFFLASETAHRHVREILEKDAREMEALIEAEEHALKGINDLRKHGFNIRRFLRIMGTLSEEFNIFDVDVFNVRLTLQLFAK